MDEATGRGVPLVELTTVHGIRCVTDSAGRIAFHEPGLMGRRVFFHVKSHGYEAPADGFGFRGAALEPAAGGRAVVKVRRTQVAERLYRLTGGGLYGHSLRLGEAVPLREGALNAEVVGQDSTQAVVHRGRIHWFWGDTARASYPLGNFATSGATSELPGRGGLAPSAGVDLTYFADETGFSRPMAPGMGEGLLWIDAVVVLRDEGGAERLVAHYSRMKSLAERLEHGLVVYDDEKRVLRRLVEFPRDPLVEPKGHSFRVRADGAEWVYFAAPFPESRVRADWRSALDPAAYEAYTCLKPGAAYDPKAPPVERDAEGRAVWAWKRGAATCGPPRQREMVDSGALRPDEAWTPIRDADSGRAVLLHAGSIRWNEHLRRWLLIAVEVGGGPSFLGEVWCSQADSPVGPWVLARKVATHESYSFYNPVQHAFFDEDGGRTVYFEGTYANTFSGNPLMYRLRLDDPRLGGRWAVEDERPFRREAAAPGSGP